jgi:hypothetical protein
MNDDIVGLLRQLKQMAFASGGVPEHPFWTLQIVMRRLLAINQGPRESVTKNYRWFVSPTEVIEVQWGKFYPETCSVLAVCAIRLNGQTDRVIRTVRIAIRTRTIAIPQ